MSIPTKARNIALYFLNKVTPAEAQHSSAYIRSYMGRTIPQAKYLLISGYTEDEIIACIDYIHDKTKTKMHSFAYVKAAIEDLLPKLDAQRERELMAQLPKEAQHDTEDTKENNANKSSQFGVQSRLRKNFDSDLFKD